MYCDQRTQLEVQRVTGKLQLSLDLSRQLGIFEKEKYEKELSIYKKYSGTHWYERPAFVAIVSVALTVLIFWGARETLKNW